MSTKMQTRPAPKAMIEHLKRLARDRDLSSLPARHREVLSDSSYLASMPTESAVNAINALNTLPVAERSEKTDKVTEIGFYRRLVAGASGMEIYKVQQSQSTGHLYAKRLTAAGEWRYDKGAIYRLTAGDRLSPEEAARYGQVTGRCACCGRELTNEESIERGIGPICWEKYF